VLNAGKPSYRRRSGGIDRIRDRLGPGRVQLNMAGGSIGEEAILHQVGDGTAHLRHRPSLSFRCVRFTWFEVAGPIERNRAWVTAHPSLTLSNSASGGESRLQKHNLRVADRPAQSKDRRSLAAVVPAYPRGIPLRQDPY
jgi:hypothetical protein